MSTEHQPEPVVWLRNPFAPSRPVSPKVWEELYKKFHQINMSPKVWEELYRKL